MRFCGKCGTAINSEKFCPSCGAPVNSVNNDSKISANKSFNKKFLFIPIFIIIIIVALLTSGRSYNSLIKTYFEASLDGDSEKLISLIPESVVEYIVEEEYDGDKEDFIADLDDTLEYFTDLLDENEIELSDVSYEIIEENTLDEEEINDIEDEYRKCDLKIKEGKEVEFEIKIPIDGDEKTNTGYFNVVKSGRSWYIIP